MKNYSLTTFKSTIKNFFLIRFLFSNIKSSIMLCGLMLFLGSIIISFKPAEDTKQDEIINTENIVSHEGKVIMAVFAHPDDEISVAPILAKYAREGAKVYLVIVTDGRYGTGTTNLKPGKEIIELRNKEVNCAAAHLGIEKPIWLGYHDQLKLKEGFFGHVPYIQDLMRDMDSLITKIQPNVIITWGPDGGSNHMDHRLVGASVSQVYLSKIWKKTKALYYVADPSSHIDNDDERILRGVDDAYLTTQISFTEEDLENTIKALKCYKTQYTVESMNNSVESMKNDKQKTIYFRPLVREITISNELFK